MIAFLDISRCYKHLYMQRLADFLAQAHDPAVLAYASHG